MNDERYQQHKREDAGAPKRGGRLLFKTVTVRPSRATPSSGYSTGGALPSCQAEGHEERMQKYEALAAANLPLFEGGA